MMRRVASALASEGLYSPARRGTSNHDTIRDVSVQSCISLERRWNIGGGTELRKQLQLRYSGSRVRSLHSVTQKNPLPKTCAPSVKIRLVGAFTDVRSGKQKQVEPTHSPYTCPPLQRLRVYLHDLPVHQCERLRGKRLDEPVIVRGNEQGHALPVKTHQ